MLARALLSVEIAAGPLNRAQKMDAFSQWYAKANARGALRPGQSKDEYLVEFMNACKKAKFTLGVNPIDQAWKVTETKSLPAESAQFDSSEGKRIVALCYQLHLLHNGGVWFLPTRELGKLINRTHTTAATWLSALVEMGIIEVASKPGMNLPPATVTLRTSNHEPTRNSLTRVRNSHSCTGRQSPRNLRYSGNQCRVRP